MVIKALPFKMLNPRSSRVEVHGLRSVIVRWPYFVASTMVEVNPGGMASDVGWHGDARRSLTVTVCDFLGVVGTEDRVIKQTLLCRSVSFD